MQLLKPIKSKRGFSLVELLLVAGLGAAALLGAVQLYTNTMESAVFVSNNNTRSALVNTYSATVLRLFKGVTPRRFDPNTTYIGSDSTNLTLAGSEWILPEGSVTLAGVKEFCFNGTFYQNSSQLDLYIFKECNDGTRHKVTKAIYFSRCVDSQLNSTAVSSLADIQALRVPRMINVAGENQLHCCEPGQPCPSADSEDRRYWPTIIIYKGDGKISMIPTAEERAVIPGMAFQVFFDRANNPLQATIVRMILENHCKMSKHGFVDADGDLRSPHNCAKTVFGNLDYQYYDTDLRVSFDFVSRTVAQDVTGSTFVDIGGLVVRESDSPGICSAAAIATHPTCTP